jgi:threonine synthase
MKYYSTNKQSPAVSLEQAVVKGLAGDKGLFMPERINKLDDEVIANMKNQSFQEIACIVARAFFGEDIEHDTLDQIVCDTLSFDTPVVHVGGRIYTLELFHGPTLAFKDVGGRFMARLLGYFIRKQGLADVNVLVATSGDTGSAVANGFLGVPGVRVFVLYPKGKVSPIQECQFTTLGQNITALEIDGTFDDCQSLVKSAFMDAQLNEHMMLTSANSINVARFLPQSFYYFNAYAQLDKIGKADNLVVSVPSGNFGNITAGLFAARMGLPIKRFLAANNRNDVFLEYLKTGIYTPLPSVSTIANAMDVGDPSNFARILELYFGAEDIHAAIKADITGYCYDDQQIKDMMKRIYAGTGYIPDPHGACGSNALTDDRLAEDEIGLFLETAHPAKFKETVDQILGIDIEIPEKLKAFMKGEKQNTELSKDFDEFKQYMLKQ